MFGFREAKQTLQALPEDLRKRALEMAAGRAQLNVRRQLRTVLTATVGIIIAGLLLVWLHKAFGLPIAVVEVGVGVIVLVASVWILTSTLREMARLQIEVARELQQLGQASSESAPSASPDEPSS